MYEVPIFTQNRRFSPVNRLCTYLRNLEDYVHTVTSSKSLFLRLMIESMGEFKQKDTDTNFFVLNNIFSTFLSSAQIYLCYLQVFVSFTRSFVSDKPYKVFTSEAIYTSYTVQYPKIEPTCTYFVDFPSF